MQFVLAGVSGGELHHHGSGGYGSDSRELGATQRALSGAGLQSCAGVHAGPFVSARKAVVGAEGTQRLNLGPPINADERG